MAGPLTTALFAGLVLAQADVPPPVVTPPAPATETTAAPTTRYGEACVLAARRTLSRDFEFRLKAVKDRTAAGMVDVWLDYEAVRLDGGPVYPEIYGCLFAAVDNPAEIVLQGAATSSDRLSPDWLAILNQTLADAGFQTRGP